MFNKTITFRVVSADDANEVMEVEFSVEGFKPVLVGLPYPFDGVSLEEHIAPHIPYRAFIEQMPKKKIKVGDGGTITPMAGST